MFGPPGYAYVYFIYGRYHCLNVVTEEAGYGAAVLLRAVGADQTKGPGKLCETWDIGFQHNGISLMNPGFSLWICPGDRPGPELIVCSRRVGITKAEELPWRFYLKGHPSVSGPKFPGSGKKRQSQN